MVAWQTCIDAPSERAENIAVLSSHIGYGHHPATIWAIADRLAQPAGNLGPIPAADGAAAVVSPTRRATGLPGVIPSLTCC